MKKVEIKEFARHETCGVKYTGKPAHLTEKFCPECESMMPMVLIRRYKSWLCWSDECRCMGCLKLFREIKENAHLVECKNEGKTEKRRK